MTDIFQLEYIYIYIGRTCSLQVIGEALEVVEEIGRGEEKGLDQPS